MTVTTVRLLAALFAFLMVWRASTRDNPAGWFAWVALLGVAVWPWLVTAWG